MSEKSEKYFEHSIILRNVYHRIFANASKANKVKRKLRVFVEFLRHA